MASSKDDVLRDFLWDSQKIVDYSQAARQQAKQQHRSNEIELKRNLSETNDKISEKIEQLSNARKKLVDASVSVEETVSKLQSAKESNDSFNVECQKHRTILQNLNHVRDKNSLLKPSADPIRKEINETLELLNMVEKNYQKNSFDCRLAISSLLSNQKDIELDLSAKRTAQMVDEDQLVKTKFSHLVTFKPTPSRLPEGAHSNIQWNRNLDDLLNDTYSKIANASNLIKNIESFIENQNVENLSKIEHLSRLLRQIYDRLNSALKNYDTQLQKVQIEMQKNEKDINDLQAHLLNVSDSMKLVETRLENRSFHRPPIAERTSDSADQALKLERQKMLDNRKFLEDQLLSLKEARKLLAASQIQVRNEIENTKKLIDTERQCFNDLESAKDRNMMESWRKIYIPSYEIGASNYAPSYTPVGTPVAERQDDKIALTD